MGSPMGKTAIMSELIGHTLGSYQIIDQIAKGGMATVYRAHQKSVGRDVAIKVLPPNFTHDDTFIERFNREVEVIARLQHPHVLPVIDYGEQDNLPYIVMAYIKGGTLTDVIVKGPMDPGEVVKMCAQIASALDFAHRKGIIHRDFKPGNILLDESGNVYLADFGLARITEQSSEITGMSVVGTPTYMAPEQSGPGEVDHTIDIYAFGVTIFQMLTGRVPYEAPTAMGILMAHMTHPVPSIVEARPDLPQDLQMVIDRALAKNPEDRYQTALKLVEEMTEILEGKPVDISTASIQEALLMTNMIGSVIFVDQQCLRVLKRHHNEARFIMGKPLHDVLGIDSTVTQELLKMVSEDGKVDALEIEIKDAQGNRMPVLCGAVATLDEKGTFVGADISLRLVVDSADPTADFDTIDERLNTREETFLQTYFKSQIDALHRLMGQWAGPRVSKHLESIINETAQRNVWPVSMTDGHITLQLRSTDSDIYRAILAKAVNYAAGVIGKNQVSREMHNVQSKMDPNVMQFVTRLGLESLIDDLLK